MTASSNCCTPLFLNDEPHEDRHELAADRALADARLEHGRIELAVLDELHERVFVERERVLEQLLPQLGDALDPRVVAARTRT